MENTMQPRLVVFRQIILLTLALVVLGAQEALALSGSQVYERVKDSVLVVGAFGRAGKAVGLGSGVVLPSGDIVTNYHVVKAGVRYMVGQRGKTAPAFLQGEDPDKDLALLLAPGLTAAPARLGQASRLQVGEKVFAVGSPQGLELSLSEGIVSQLRGGPPPLIQTTVAISPGSSGGGLFNDQGELVGIMTFQLKEGQNLNFALPVEWVNQVDGKKIRERSRRQAPVDPELAERPKGARKDFDPSDYILPQERALECQKAKDWHGMIEACNAWIYNEPDSADAWFKLGLAYGQLGSHREAIEAFREALRLKPDDAYVWNNLGVTYGNMGRHREAIESYREALRLKPDDADAWYNLGLAYGNMDRHREEIEAYREALRLKPDFAEAWYNLGVSYGQLRRYREEIDAYREALRLKPDYAKAWWNLGASYANSGNRSAALQAVKELRRYDPQKADKLFNLIMKP